MSNFDQFANEYSRLHRESIAASGFSPISFAEMKVRYLANFLVSRGLPSPKRILNFGCGSGKSEPFLRDYFPETELTGVDISHKSIEVARSRNAGVYGLTYTVVTPEQGLPSECDIVFAANVFHHISLKDRPAELDRIRACLSERGMVFVFEHNPLNPLTRRAVNICQFDDDAILLWPRYAKKLFKDHGFTPVCLDYIVFFPRILQWFIPLEAYLNWLPVGAQYCLVARKS